MVERRVTHKGDNIPEGGAELEQVIQSLPEQQVVGSEERIDPRVMAFLLQASSTSQLSRLRKLEESKVPVKTISIDFTVTRLERLWQIDPLISFTLVNDGPNSVFVEANGVGGLEPQGSVDIGDTFEVDMTYPVIRNITLDVAAGESAAIKIKGKVGQAVF